MHYYEQIGKENKIDMQTCEQHKNLTIIERVFVEKVLYIVEEAPPENTDWYGDPIRWHDPQVISITVTCADCGVERIYKSYAALPKWVRTLLPQPETNKNCRAQ